MLLKLMVISQKVKSYQFHGAETLIYNTIKVSL